MSDASASTDPAARDRVLGLLRKYGRNTCSFLALESDLFYWFDGDDGCVAYADTGGAWIVAGEPIAPQHRVAEVMEAFAAAAGRAGKRIRFFGLEAVAAGEFSHLLIGEQPMWDPKKWPDILREKKSLREQLRRARAKGVTIRELSEAELAEGATDRAKVDRLLHRWLGSRAIAPMGFLVKLDLYHLPEERRFLVAEVGDVVVGILAAVPIYEKNGWFFEDVLRDPDAPNGTIELLFDHAMRLVAEGGSRHVTFGLAPLAESDNKWLRRIRDNTRWLYDFDGLRAFKAKLVPSQWQPVYLAFPAKERGVRAVVDVLAAFAHGSFLFFGWRTLIHRAPVVVAILAVLLVPWITLMATTDAAHWFPSATAQLLWIAFDGVLLLGLVVLSVHWRKWLAGLLAAAAAADFAVGLFQTLWFNLPRLRGLADVAVVIAALSAPLFATFFLSAVRNRIPREARPGY